jgi:hypothetical protein
VLVGGESKPGSTEDEGIGGDGKLEKQMLCPKTNISSSERSRILPLRAPTNMCGSLTRLIFEVPIILAFAQSLSQRNKIPSKIKVFDLS